MNYRGTLTIREIANFIGKSEVFVRRSIENGSLDIGAYDREGKRANYYISPKLAYERLGYKRDEENLGDYSADSSDYLYGSQGRCAEGMGNSLLNNR